MDNEQTQEPMAYALRPFTASIAGQVTAHSGEPLVLVSDTHWYWWLVRVLRTETVGYIPAEYIELPNERLARENRDLNLTVSGSDRKPNRRPSLKKVRFHESLIVEYDEDVTDLGVRLGGAFLPSVLSGSEKYARADDNDDEFHDSNGSFDDSAAPDLVNDETSDDSTDYSDGCESPTQILESNSNVFEKTLSEGIVFRRISLTEPEPESKPADPSKMMGSQLLPWAAWSIKNVEA